MRGLIIIIITEAMYQIRLGSPHTVLWPSILFNSGDPKGQLPGSLSAHTPCFAGSSSACRLEHYISAPSPAATSHYDPLLPPNMFFFAVIYSFYWTVFLMGKHHLSTWSSSSLSVPSCHSTIQQAASNTCHVTLALRNSASDVRNGVNSLNLTPSMSYFPLRICCIIVFYQFVLLGVCLHCCWNASTISCAETYAAAIRTLVLRCVWQNPQFNGIGVNMA